MATVPFSIRLDETIRARLEKEAVLEDRSASYIVQKVVNHYLDGRDRFRQEMEAAIAEADKGVFISGEAMHRWIESWDTDNELPPPEPDIFPDDYKP